MSGETMILTPEELAAAKHLCRYCDAGWSLNRLGCHYEPVEDEEGEPYAQHAVCAAWKIRRIEFYGR
jgi:hypothetical protein